MSERSKWNFECPWCHAKYQIVRIKVPFSPPEKATCQNCMHDLPPRDPSDLLQYTLVERPLPPVA
jgi:hypothetical protein